MQRLSVRGAKVNADILAAKSFTFTHFYSIVQRVTNWSIKMKTPNFKKLIAVLKTVEHDGELNMRVPHVYATADYDDRGGQKVTSGGEHKCGTVHCFAGWYAVAKLKAGWEGYGEDYMGFEEGIALIDRDAGMSLREWVCSNSEIWGRGNVDIYLHKSSWGNAENLTGIIKYLEDVDARVDALAEAGETA